MKRLSQKIAEEFDWYVAISRGGLIPTALLSYITQVRKIDTFCIFSYQENQNQSSFTIIPKDYHHLRNQRVLLIDDLTDSGQTLACAKKYLTPYLLKTLKTAVIYKKKESFFLPDYYIEEKEPHKWIDFFWEINQDI